MRRCVWYYWGPKRICRAGRSTWQEASCQTGACAVLAQARELVQYIVRIKICEKALGVSWWMDPCRKFLKYSWSPLGEYWRFPEGFPNVLLETSLGAPFTMIHPRLSHRLSQCTIHSVYCVVYTEYSKLRSVYCVVYISSQDHKYFFYNINTKKAHCVPYATLWHATCDFFTSFICLSNISQMPPLEQVY